MSTGGITARGGVVKLALFPYRVCCTDEARLRLQMNSKGRVSLRRCVFVGVAVVNVYGCVLMIFLWSQAARSFWGPHVPLEKRKLDTSLVEGIYEILHRSGYVLTACVDHMTYWLLWLP